MIQLYVFPSGKEIPNYSAPCMKVETWLRLAKLPYEKKILGDPSRAPKGKLPYIVEGAHTVADSEFIIAHLSQQHGVDLDESLSAEEKAVARAFERMLNEHSYFGLVYARWIAPEGWVQTKPAFFGKLPPIVRDLAAAHVRKKIRRDLQGQGLGRHSAAEIESRIAQDLQAVSDYLADQPFMMGREPTTIDATVYAYIGNLLLSRNQTVLSPLARRHPNLVAYCTRMTQRCFPELKA